MAHNDIKHAASGGGEVDAVSGVETTGHEWDGLKELNNPAPRWWLLTWLVCIIWAVGYWWVYPAWPTLKDHTLGSFGWTEYRELKDSQGEIAARKGVYLAKLHDTKLDDIQKDPALFEFARAGGAAAFKTNCAPCHGTGAAGGHGYPNLNDDDWIWGGSLDAIHTTLLVGVRSISPDTRQNAMPAFGRDGLLKPAEIEHVADYVLSLSGKAGSASPANIAAGEKVFTEQCVACHGEKGVGNPEMGAPKLSDAIWLYGGERRQIIAQVTNPKMGVMPTWGGRLDDDTIKQLTVYVHSLGGGQ